MIPLIKSKEYKGKKYKSEEETMFAIWLDEAKKFGLVEKWMYEPIKYILLHETRRSVNYLTKSGLLKNKDLLIAYEQSYTPDFFVVFTPKFFSSYKKSDQSPLFIFDYVGNFCIEIYEELEHKKHCVLFDVKPSNMSFVRRISTSASTFYIKRALLYDKYGIVVEKVTPKNLMQKTFVPDMMAFIPSRKNKVRYKDFENCKLSSEVFSQETLF